MTTSYQHSSFDVERSRALLAEREEFDRRSDPTRRGVWLTRPAVDIALRDACDEIERLEEQLETLRAALEKIDYGIEVDWSKGVDENCERLREVARAALSNPAKRRTQGRLP